METIPLDIPALAQRIPDEAAAYELLETLRWDGKPVCPHCGSVAKHYFLTPKNPEGRKTRTGTVSARRVWKCKDCRRQFSVLTGTIFHGSKVPLRTWLFVVVEMCASKNGIAAREIERKYDVATKTAWFMAHRIREAMNDPHLNPFVGTIEADETWIGGKSRVEKPDGMPQWEFRKYAADRRLDNKTPVLSILNRDTGEVRSRAVPDVTGATLSAELRKHTQPAASVLHTDERKGYKAVARRVSDAQRVRRLLGQTAGRRLTYRGLIGG